VAIERYFGGRGSGRRLVWIAVTLVGLLLIPAVLTARTVEKQRYDGVRINLAGRQRMLTQKLCKDILLYAQGRTSAKVVRRTMRAFHTTLFALLNGGQAPLDLRSGAHRKLPPMQDASIRAQLQRVISLWSQFSRRLEDYLAKRNEAALEYVIRTNATLLGEMDRSVSMMQKRSEKNTTWVSGILLGTVVAALILLGFLLLRKVSELRMASAHIQKLETLLPICASCKNIRKEDEASPGGDESTLAWVSIEQYLHDEESMEFTHSICPDCREKLYPSPSHRSSG